MDILIELDRICKKCDIRYILDGGTLLGAVRHGGFIPWDDDVDVLMTRGEYIRFRKACEIELDEKRYFFQDNTTDVNYRWGYGRIRRKNSEFVRVGQEHLKMKTGIFLDIFPRDNVPDPYVIRFFHNFYCFILRKVLYAETGMISAKSILTRTWYKILYIIPSPFIFRRLEKLAEKYNSKNTKLMRTLTFPMFNKNRFGYSREWFENTSEIQFEGHIFSCPLDFNGYLSELYGDFMTLPPPEKRHWHPAAKFCLPED